MGAGGWRLGAGWSDRPFVWGNWRACSFEARGFGLIDLWGCSSDRRELVRSVAVKVRWAGDGVEALARARGATQPSVLKKNGEKVQGTPLHDPVRGRSPLDPRDGSGGRPQVEGAHGTGARSITSAPAGGRMAHGRDKRESLPLRIRTVGG